MAEFIYSPPVAILYIAGGILVLTILSMFLKKGRLSRRIIALIVVVVVVSALVFVVYRPVTLTVSSEGIRTSGVNPIDLPWSEVTSAGFEADLANSEYRPTVRTRGTVIGSYRTGRFLLSNGDSARVYMERSDQAVVIITDELTYLFAPQDVEGLAAAIDTYRVITP